MRKAIRIVLLVILSHAFSAHADEAVVLYAPKPLDVELADKMLDGALPRLSFQSDAKARDVLDNYIVQLRDFNTVRLDGFRKQIEKNCRNNRLYAGEVNELFENELLTMQDYAHEIEKIEAERRRCDERYRSTSPYWQVHDRFKRIYNDLERDALKRIAVCESRDSCRRREK